MSIWGPVQHRKSYSPTDDIVFVSTASHGGFIVHSENDCIPDEWKDMTFFRQGWEGYYEEDEDWCFVVLTFPERFSVEDCELALNTFISRIRMVREGRRRM